MIQQSSPRIDMDDRLAPKALAELVPAPGEAGLVTQRPASERLDVVPQHALQPLPPRAGLGSAAGLVVAALILHAGFIVVFIHLLDWRLVDTSVERSIPVEIVSAMPREAKSPGNATPNASSLSSTGSGAPSEPQPAAKPQGAAPPPPPFVAPPPEPTRAASQTEQPKPANVAPEAPKPIQPEPTPPPPRAPETLAAAKGDFSVAPAGKNQPNPAPQPKPPAAGPKPKESADLSAALPMDFAGMPSSFRAVLSGAGSQASEDYKGLVFGRLGRSQDATERARAQGLRGIVVVSFTVSDEGGISDIHIARSSGVAALDAIAVDMVKEAAPFPPPPPGGQRTFTPALSFGDQ